MSDLAELEWGRDLDPGKVGDSVQEFLALLGGPCLIHVPGRDPSRLRAVATLLHGDEPSGARAVHRWLAGGPEPAVDALLLIGAVHAALAPPGFAHRFLAGDGDFNRCWVPPHLGVEGERALFVLGRLRRRPPECLVDLHNNTGRNPAYGVAPIVGAAERNLVGLFANRLIHMGVELGTLVEATAHDWPSVTVECGRSGDPAADHVAFEGLARLLSRPDLGLDRTPPPLDVIVNPVRVCVRADVDLDFGESPGRSRGLTVSREIERHNFEWLPPGSCIGWVAAGCDWPLEALGPGGRDVSIDLFEVREGRLVTRVPIVPTMMTTSREAVLADCLFYAGVGRGA